MDSSRGTHRAESRAPGDRGTSDAWPLLRSGLSFWQATTQYVKWGRLGSCVSKGLGSARLWSGWSVVGALIAPPWARPDGAVFGPRSWALSWAGCPQGFMIRGGGDGVSGPPSLWPVLQWTEEQDTQAAEASPGPASEVAVPGHEERKEAELRAIFKD